MNEYIKGITLTATELKALSSAIENQVWNSTHGLGCSPERFAILKGIGKRLDEATK